MRQNPDTGDVGGLRSIRIGLPVLYQRVEKLIHQMRVRPTVSPTLGKRQMLMLIGIVATFCGKPPDAPRQRHGDISELDFFRKLRIWSLRSMDGEWPPFNKGPFNGFLRTINFETLPLSPGYVEQRPVNMCAQVGIF